METGQPDLHYRPTDATYPAVPTTPSISSHKPPDASFRETPEDVMSTSELQATRRDWLERVAVQGPDSSGAKPTAARPTPGRLDASRLSAHEAPPVAARRAQAFPKPATPNEQHKSTFLSTRPLESPAGPQPSFSRGPVATSTVGKDDPNIRMADDLLFEGRAHLRASRPALAEGVLRRALNEYDESLDSSQGNAARAAAISAKWIPAAHALVESLLKQRVLAKLFEAELLLWKAFERTAATQGVGLLKRRELFTEHKGRLHVLQAAQEYAASRSIQRAYRMHSRQLRGIPLEHRKEAFQQMRLRFASGGVSAANKTESIHVAEAKAAVQEGKETTSVAVMSTTSDGKLAAAPSRLDASTWIMDDDGLGMVRVGNASSSKNEGLGAVDDVNGPQPQHGDENSGVDDNDDGLAVDTYVPVTITVDDDGLAVDANDGDDGDDDDGLAVDEPSAPASASTWTKGRGSHGTRAPVNLGNAAPAGTFKPGQQWRPDSQSLHFARLRAGSQGRVLEGSERLATFRGERPGEAVQLDGSRLGKHQWRPAAYVQNEARIEAARHAVLAAMAASSQPAMAEIATSLQRYRTLGLHDFDAPRQAHLLCASAQQRNSESAPASTPQKEPRQAKSLIVSKLGPLSLGARRGAAVGSVSAMLTKSRATRKALRSRTSRKREASGTSASTTLLFDADATCSACSETDSPAAVPDIPAAQSLEGKTDSAATSRDCLRSPQSSEEMNGWVPACTCDRCTTNSQIRWLKMFETSLPEDIQQYISRTESAGSEQGLAESELARAAGTISEQTLGGGSGRRSGRQAGDVALGGLWKPGDDSIGTGKTAGHAITTIGGNSAARRYSMWSRMKYRMRLGLARGKAQQDGVLQEKHVAADHSSSAPTSRMRRLRRVSSSWLQTARDARSRSFRKGTTPKNPTSDPTALSATQDMAI